MPSITEGKLKFDFPDGWEVSKYDEWSYYRNQFIKTCGGTKAIDILALEPKACCWLLEVKDYREFVRTKTIDLAEEIAAKVRDTLAGIVGAQYQANEAEEKKIGHPGLAIKMGKSSPSPGTANETLKAVSEGDQPGSRPAAIETAYQGNRSAPPSG